MATITLGVVGRIMSNTEGAQTAARKARSLVLPDAFAGDTSWSDWVDHFEAAARVNGWDDATKLNWLPVRLNGSSCGREN